MSIRSKAHDALLDSVAAEAMRGIAKAAVDAWNEAGPSFNKGQLTMFQQAIQPALYEFVAYVEQSFPDTQSDVYSDMIESALTPYDNAAETAFSETIDAAQDDVDQAVEDGQQAYNLAEQEGDLLDHKQQTTADAELDLEDAITQLEDAIESGEADFIAQAKADLADAKGFYEDAFKDFEKELKDVGKPYQTISRDVRGLGDELHEIVQTIRDTYEAEVAGFAEEIGLALTEAEAIEFSAEAEALAAGAFGEALLLSEEEIAGLLGIEEAELVAAELLDGFEFLFFII